MKMIATENKGDEVRLVIEGLREISTIPVILKKILEVVDDEGTSINDLREIIECDQSISSRIIGIANAAFYGHSRNVDTISKAILILGFDMVKCIAISVSIFDIENKRYYNEIKKLWLHSFEVAFLTRLIAEKRGLGRKDAAFLSGLLHDVGRAILFQIFEDKYVFTCLSNRDSLLRCEKEAFGVTHPLAGAWFAERYLFPEDCVEAIQYHHRPEICLSSNLYSSHHLIPSVYLADSIVSGRGGSFEGDCERSERHDEILDLLSIDSGVVKEIESELEEAEDEIRCFMDLSAE